MGMCREGTTSDEECNAVYIGFSLFSEVLAQLPFIGTKVVMMDSLVDYDLFALVAQQTSRYHWISGRGGLQEGAFRVFSSSTVRVHCSSFLLCKGNQPAVFSHPPCTHHGVRHYSANILRHHRNPHRHPCTLVYVAHCPRQVITYFLLGLNPKTHTIDHCTDL